MLERNKNLHEEKKAFTSLSRVKYALLPLKSIGSLSYQVTQLMRIVEMKYHALYILQSILGVAHKEL